MDKLTGRIVSALAKGGTDSVSMIIDDSKLPEPAKNFLNKLLNNVDELVVETCVQRKPTEVQEKEEPQPVSAIKRPDATPELGSNQEVEIVQDRAEF